MGLHCRAATSAAQAEDSVLPFGDGVIQADEGQNGAEDRQNSPNELGHTIRAFGHIDRFLTAAHRALLTPGAFGASLDSGTGSVEPAHPQASHRTRTQPIPH